MRKAGGRGRAVNPLVIIPFVIELLKAAPELVSDVEKVIAIFKGHPGEPEKAASLAQQIIADTAPYVAKLQGS